MGRPQGCWSGLDDRDNGDTNIAGLRENEHRTAIDESRMALGGANDARALIDTVRAGAVAVELPDLARLGRRHEVQGHLKKAVETFDTARKRAGEQR